MFNNGKKMNSSINKNITKRKLLCASKCYLIYIPTYFLLILQNIDFLSYLIVKLK